MQYGGMVLKKNAIGITFFGDFFLCFSRKCLSMFWYPLFAYLFALGYYFQQTDDLEEENVVSYTEK